jgi:hypothetical protein
MAETFTYYSKDQAFAATKNMGCIKNLHATEKLKVRRVGLLNAQTGTPTGVVCLIEFRLDINPTFSAPTQTGVTICKHDSVNTAPANYLYGSIGSYAAGSAFTLRRTVWSSDEPAASTATSDELQCFVPLNILFDAGYGDSNVQPLTLNQNDASLVYNTSGAAGLVDIWIEFTRE